MASRQDRPLAPPDGAPIALLMRLLLTWTDAAFPLPEGGAPAGQGDQRISREAPARDLLALLWQAIEEALCGQQQRWLVAFYKEHRDLRLQARDGDPPVKTLAARLQELASTGVHEWFLAVAVRQACGRLVGERCSTEAIGLWCQLSEWLLPDSAQFWTLTREAPGTDSGWARFGPSAPDGCA